MSEPTKTRVQEAREPGDEQGIDVNTSVDRQERLGDLG
jgi:hypothetical protein